MTVKEFFSTNREMDYCTVNIINVNTEDEIDTNTDEINDGALSICWYDSKIQMWEICGDKIYLCVI